MVTRQPLIPKVLSVSEGAAVARKPFKPPCIDGYKDGNYHLARRLSARKRFVPWGSTRPVLVPVVDSFNIPNFLEKEEVEEKLSLPPGVEPLVLWQSMENVEGVDGVGTISVDPLLVRFLRPHQRLHFLKNYVSVEYLLFDLKWYSICDVAGKEFSSCLTVSQDCMTQLT